MMMRNNLYCYPLPEYKGDQPFFFDRTHTTAGVLVKCNHIEGFLENSLKTRYLYPLKPVKLIRTQIDFYWWFFHKKKLYSMLVVVIKFITIDHLFWTWHAGRKCSFHFGAGTYERCRMCSYAGTMPCVDNASF